jgi:hypothetical protein
VIALGLCAAAARAKAIEGMGDTTSAPRCKFDKKIGVMALVYNAREPKRSFAMIATGPGESRMVRVGSHVAGRPVVAVLPSALWLGPADNLCWMPLDHEGKQKVRKVKRRRSERKKRKR